jgi:hypothetical protein
MTNSGYCRKPLGESGLSLGPEAAQQFEWQFY